MNGRPQDQGSGRKQVRERERAVCESGSHLLINDIVRVKNGKKIKTEDGRRPKGNGKALAVYKVTVF